MKSFILAVFFIIGTNVNGAEWNILDVSYLLTLPKNNEVTNDEMVSPKTKGKLGTLVNFDLYNRLPPLDNAGNGQQTMYDKDLKLVGVRVDPCPNTQEEKKCSPEVRLVWQPIVYDIDDKKWTASDASLHTFYSLSKNEFSLLAKDLWNLKLENQKMGVDTSKSPLNIHPALFKSSKFFPSLKNIILSYCGEKNLKKLTFMSLLTRNVWWRFGGIELKKGKWEVVIVPRVNLAFIDIFNSAFEENPPKNNPGKAMDGIFNIFPDDYPSEDNIFSLINNYERFNDERDLPVFKTKLSAVDRFMNPLKTNPTNLDCASCHFADNAKFYAESRFPELKGFQSKDAFKNPNTAIYNVSNQTIGNKGTRLVRAFGYFYELPSINQRVIHDSVDSAEWMNKRYKF